MTFSEALEKLKCNFRIKRKGWNGQNQYLSLEFYEYLTLKYCIILHHSDCKYSWSATQADLLANDWEIVP